MTALWIVVFACLAFCGLMVAIEFFAPNVASRIFGDVDPDENVHETNPRKVRKARARARAELEAQRVATPLCKARWDNLHCQRAAWHAGQHAHTLPKGKVVTWHNLADCGGAA